MAGHRPCSCVSASPNLTSCSGTAPSHCSHFSCLAMPSHYTRSYSIAAQSQCTNAPIMLAAWPPSDPVQTTGGPPHKSLICIGPGITPIHLIIRVQPYVFAALVNLLPGPHLVSMMPVHDSMSPSSYPVWDSSVVI